MKFWNPMPREQSAYADLLLVFYLIAIIFALLALAVPLLGLFGGPTVNPDSIWYA